MKIVYDTKNGDYIESESGEKVMLYTPWDKNAIVKAWKFGLEESWEAARKIVCEKESGGLSMKQLSDIFGMNSYGTILKLLDAKQAIKKIKDYEENKNTENENGQFIKKALEKHKEDYRELIQRAISETFDRLNENKSEEEKKMDNTKKEFLRIVVTGTKEHPYYTIDYIENGEEHNGYGSYNLGYVLKWKEEMEIYNAQIEEKNKSKGEKKMKSGDKFIIELGEKTRIQSENSKGEWKASDEFFRIDGTGSVISAKDLMNLKEYKENNDEKENVKYVSPEMLEKINITPGKGMEKFQEEKAQRADVEKGSAVGKKFVIEIEKEEEGCYFELKGTNERYFETVCKIKGTNAYIKKADLDKLEKREEKKKEEEVKVGDEIENGLGAVAVVTRVTKNLHECLGVNGFFYLSKSINLWKKTEKHYDEVEKIFQKLKESEGEIPFL